jgi:hypothetical protein
MSTMPLSTATPKSAMKPTPALMLKGMPRSQSASTPPTAANGTALKISRALRVLLNARNSRKKISNRATGTATPSRAVASCRFWKVPP